MKRRLLAVQGPLQFIAGYVALSWQRKVKEVGDTSEDHLLLYDFLTSASAETDLARTVIELSGVHSWAKVTIVTGAEMTSIMSQKYPRSMSRLKALLGQSGFDEIYLARDEIGHGSALIINTYQSARRIVYGDSLGLFGMPEPIRGPSLIGSARSLVYRSRCWLRRALLGGPKVLPFHDAILSIPIINSGASLKGISLDIPSRQHVLSCIENIRGMQKGLASHCASLVRLHPGHAKYLYLLSNLSAAGYMSMRAEVNLYLEVIRETPVGSTVIIKPHPRSAYELLDLVSRGLGNEYNLVIADDAEFSRFPVELWTELVEACTVVPILSTSAIHLSYLYGKSVVSPLNEDRIRRYFVGDNMEYLLRGQEMISQALSRVRHWDGASVLWQKQA